MNSAGHFLAAIIDDVNVPQAASFRDSIQRQSWWCGATPVSRL
jgi:hypothetical protein